MKMTHWKQPLLEIAEEIFLPWLAKSWNRDMKNSYKTSKAKLAKRWTRFKRSQGYVQHRKDFGQIRVAQEEPEIMTEIFKNRFDKDLQCTPPSSVVDKSPAKAKEWQAFLTMLPKGTSLPREVGWDKVPIELIRLINQFQNESDLKENQPEKVLF